MSYKLIILLIFIITSFITAFLILKKPFVKIRLNKRDIRLDTFFLGCSLSAILIIVLGFLSFDQIKISLLGNEKLNPLGILILFFSYLLN